MIKYAVTTEKNVVTFVIYGNTPFKDVRFPLGCHILDTTNLDVQVGDIYRDGMYYHPDGTVCAYIPDEEQVLEMPDSRRPETIFGKLASLEKDNKELRKIANDLLVADLKREGAIV